MPRRTREQSKAETREALLIAALGLFGEKGISGPSLDRICEVAGYTRGAFYVHFADREELATAVVEQVIQRWTAVIVQTADDAGHDLDRSIELFVTTAQRAMADPSSDPFLAAGTTHLHVLLEGAQRHPRLHRRFVEMLDEAVVQLGEVIAAGQVAGTVRADLDPRAMAELLVTTVLGVLATAPLGFPGNLLQVRDAARSLLSPRAG